MKKLNRKGFTLVELLAVIVILAILAVVTIPTVLNALGGSKKSTLHSSAVTSAKWYDDTLAADALLGTTDQVIAGKIKATTATGYSSAATWNGSATCLGNLLLSASGTDTLFAKIGLNDKDLKSTGTIPTFNADGTATVTTASCSAIRLVNNRAEIVLVGTTTGKFASGSNVIYAYSKDTSGKETTS